jgi:hypothetical protein
MDQPAAWSSHGWFRMGNQAVTGWKQLRVAQAADLFAGLIGWILDGLNS